MARAQAHSLTRPVISHAYLRYEALSPPTAPNTYTDGGLTKPAKHELSLGGFGIWDPDHADEDKFTSKEIEPTRR